MKSSPLTLTKLALLSLSSALLLACTTAPSNDTLESKSRTSSSFVEGVAGGAFSEVEKISATVSAIDYKTRSVMLKDAQGNKRTVIASPDVANLDQVKVGDQVNIVAAVETVVYLRDRGQSAQDGAAAMVLSGTGSNVGVLRSANQQFTAVVTAVDMPQHKVTLKYSDNSSKTLAVRKDVAISPSDVGREVVINISHAMAITVDPR
jgi:Cu/Ag efflux protein CusF